MFDEHGHIRFKPVFKKRSNEGAIYGESGRCMNCKASAICIKVSIDDIHDLETVDICKACTDRVFANAFNYYRERNQDIKDSIFGMPEDLRREVEQDERDELAMERENAKAQETSP